MVTYNRLEFTRKAIAALQRHDAGAPWVLTVVDNGSSDGTPAYLQELHAQGIITHLELLPENRGVAAAANLAWSQEPEADWYLKLDNDIVVEKPGWLADLVDAVEQVPTLGAVAANFEPVSYPVTELEGYRLRVKHEGNLGGGLPPGPAPHV
jgi:GT2 family glycosyltransferase